MTKNSICHIEWSSTNLERTRDFLTNLFGWKFEPFGEEYLLFSPPSGVGGGIMKVDEVNPGESPLVYIDVEEIEPYLERARELGGEVAVEKTPVPKVGWFAHISDPDGNIVGLVKGEEHE